MCTPNGILFLIGHIQNITETVPVNAGIPGNLICKPHLCISNCIILFAEVYVEEEDFLFENLTAEEKALKAKGMTLSDTDTTNIATGALGVAFILTTAVSVIALDALSITYHCALLKQNLSHVFRR